MVRRGRTSPLLNPFKTTNGVRYLWTTYGAENAIDQIDLNYHNPQVLLEMIKIFLFYLGKGASIVRFDGVGGLWKKLGTSCKHLPENHAIVVLFREIIKRVGSGKLMFTETTTASFDENIVYLNAKEAHAVYNFALAPLVLLSFYTGASRRLSEYARKLDPPAGNTFFNILDIHDGINVYSTSKEIPESELEIVFDRVRKNGAEFSYRNLPDGQKAIKEIHITWWSALNKDGQEPFELQLQKFITSRAMAMSLKGIPAVYYLSLFGSKNDMSVFRNTQHARDINRTNFGYNDISRMLVKKDGRESRIFDALMNLIERRKNLSAFHPNAKQEVLSLDNRVFAVLRGEGNDRVIALHNVSKEKVDLAYNGRNFRLEPYSFIWELI